MNGDRLLRIARLLREAEQLSQEECRAATRDDTRLTRMTALLWIGRDAADELVEQYVADHARGPGRPERDHYDEQSKENE